MGRELELGHVVVKVLVAKRLLLLFQSLKPLLLLPLGVQLLRVHIHSRVYEECRLQLLDGLLCSAVNHVALLCPPAHGPVVLPHERMSRCDGVIDFQPPQTGLAVGPCALQSRLVFHGHRELLLELLLELLRRLASLPVPVLELG